MNQILVSIGTSLAATIIGAIAAWIINQKRNSDRVDNEIEGISNDIKDIKGQMTNGFEKVNNSFERVANDRDSLLYEFRRLTDEHRGLNERVEGIKSEFASDVLKTLGSVVQEYESTHRKSTESRGSKQFEDFWRNK